MAEDPQTLFAELDDFIQAESHEEALEVCERILALAADDGDAFHCKLISLIELGRYAEAVQAVEAHGELAAGREFEHAYCLYQLNREPEALALLDQAGLDVARNAQLAAQIRFRLGEYARAAELFQVAEGEEGGSAESSVNTLAALVSAGQTDAALAYAEQAGSSDDGAQFELLYNLACAHIEKGELGRAQLLLQRALETCRESLTAEEYSEEEIEASRRRRPPAPARPPPPRRRPAPGPSAPPLCPQVRYKKQPGMRPSPGIEVPGATPQRGAVTLAPRAPAARRGRRTAPPHDPLPRPPFTPRWSSAC